jgi:hypothetical protein
MAVLCFLLYGTPAFIQHSETAVSEVKKLNRHLDPGGYTKW